MSSKIYKTNCIELMRVIQISRFLPKLKILVQNYRFLTELWISQQNPLFTMSISHEHK